MIVEHPQPQPAPRSALSRTRYLVIGAVVALAVAIGAVLGGVLVTSGAAPLARAADYVPADAVMYAEVSLDLTGSQRADLRALLEQFPAADADALLTDALAETLDEALADDGAPIDYTHDVAPWFDGTLAMTLLDFPMSPDPEHVELPSMVGMFGVRDVQGATATADELRAEAVATGATFSSGEHAGLTIWTLEVESGDLPGKVADTGFAYAITDDQLLVGSSAEAIRAALDAEAGDSLAESPEVGRLLDELPEDAVGVGVVSSAAMVAELRAELESAESGLAEALEGYLAAVPPVSVGALSLAADAVLVDSAAALPAGSLRPENTERDLASHVPADAILFADGSQVGAALEQAIAGMKAAAAAVPDGESGIAELEGIEAALGADLEEFVSWIGDGAMAAGWEGDAPWFGLVLHARDAAAAESRLRQLGALAALAAGQPGSGVQLSTESVDGVEVTTVTFGGGMVEDAGLPDQQSIQYALDGETALFGVGGEFVPIALAIDPDDSLAASDRFAAALERFGGTPNAGSVFLDLAALRTTLGAQLPAGAEAFGLVLPNFEPLDLVAGVTRVDGDSVVTQLGLVVR